MNERHTPTQKRAHITRDKLLFAAQIVIAREGRDRFTTAMVAEEAGKSIGTVYRYFTDRVAILDRLYPNRAEGLVSVDGHKIPDAAVERVARALADSIYGEGGFDSLEADVQESYRADAREILPMMPHLMSFDERWPNGANPGPIHGVTTTSSGAS